MLVFFYLAKNYEKRAHQVYKVEINQHVRKGRPQHVIGHGANQQDNMQKVR